MAGENRVFGFHPPPITRHSPPFFAVLVDEKSFAVTVEIMRICHLGKFYPPASGGIETHLQTLARSQAALGGAVSVLCVNHRDRNGQDVTWRKWAATETVSEMDGEVRLLRSGRIASFARLDLCPDLLEQIKQVVRGGVDLLHMHTPNPTMLIALAILRPRACIVITHHSDVIRQRYLKYLQLPFERAVYRRAGRILSDSPGYAGGSSLLQEFPRRVRDLPLGIDLSPYLEPNSAACEHAGRLRKLHGEPLWLSVGRLNYYKGLDVGIRALREVPGKLLVIGTGPFLAKWQELAKTEGVADRVIWRGHADADELTGAYQAATAFWFPSNARSEGFGLVQVEAMASGCPVINTAIPHSGVSWVSKHMESGLTVPVNDPKALATAARRLLEEPGLREQLGRAGVERAQRDFNQALMAERSLAFYREALEIHRRS